MPEISAGLLMFRGSGEHLEVLLAHPGGPFWAKRDEGAWSLPKGLVDANEEQLAAAQREFTEETGLTATPPFLPLGEVRQKSGKRVHAWGFAGDCDPLAIVSNSFMAEWPPKSGRMQSFPEVDRCAFFNLDEARRRIISYQSDFLARLHECLQAQAPHA